MDSLFRRLCAALSIAGLACGVLGAPGWAAAHREPATVVDGATAAGAGVGAGAPATTASVPASPASVPASTASVPASPASSPVPSAMAASAISSVLDADGAFRASQAAIGRTVGDYAFRDREGRQVRLSSFRGKPLLVNFVYTGCISACPVTTKRIAELIASAQRTLGATQFNVITVGINPPADSPESMRDFARRFGLEAANWEFLTPYEGQVGALTGELGFSYVPTSWGFDHVAQVTVLDAGGRVHRQVYGEDFAQRQLIEPLKELISGSPLPMASAADLLERVRILCTIYDPASGGYRLNYTIVAQIIGITLAALTLLVYIVYEFRVRQRARRAAA